MVKANGAKQKFPDGLGREQLLDMYYFLQLTRQLEQVLVNLYRQNKVIGGLYRSLGQEGTAIGSAYALNRRTDATGDMLAPAIRNLGSLLLMGAKPVEFMKQYMAKGDSPTRGREQNVHFADYEKGYFSPISHLGTMTEIMAGVALTFKLRKEPRVALAYSGDGASSTGAFHEGFNFAAVQRAPLVVIIENNGYAYSTPKSKMTAAERFVDKAAGYGVHGEQCDGNDLIAVYEMTKRAVERARRGEGASLLETLSYRRKGHAEHDNQAYVPAGEIEAWELKDPVARFEARMLTEGWGTQQEMDAIAARVVAEIDAAREAAEASGLPEPEWALGDVYGDLDTAAPWTRLSPVDPRRA
jgi:TPP-dependent pyruvate/acetoin dehydrogenase alpha subunit